MNCQNSRELLALYADNSLEGQDKVNVEKHLAACPACTAELAGLKESLELLQSLPEPLPPENLHQHIMKGIGGEKKRNKGNAQELKGMRYKIKYVAAAVFLFFLIGGNVLIMTQGNLLPQAGSFKGIEMDSSLEESTNDGEVAPVVEDNQTNGYRVNNLRGENPAEAGGRNPFRTRNLLIFNLTLISLSVLLCLVYSKYFPGKIRN